MNDQAVECREWTPVPGGDQAPTTPRGTPQAREPVAHDDTVETADDDDAQMDAEAEARDIEMDFVGSLEVADELGQLEPSAGDVASALLLQQLWSLGRSY